MDRPRPHDCPTLEALEPRLLLNVADPWVGTWDVAAYQVDTHVSYDDGVFHPGTFDFQWMQDQVQITRAGARYRVTPQGAEETFLLSPSADGTVLESHRSGTDHGEYSDVYFSIRRVGDDLAVVHYGEVGWDSADRENLYWGDAVLGVAGRDGLPGGPLEPWAGDYLVREFTMEADPFWNNGYTLFNEQTAPAHLDDLGGGNYLARSGISDDGLVVTEAGDHLEGGFEDLEDGYARGYLRIHQVDGDRIWYVFAGAGADSDAYETLYWTEWNVGISGLDDPGVEHPLIVGDFLHVDNWWQYDSHETLADNRDTMRIQVTGTEDVEGFDTKQVEWQWPDGSWERMNWFLTEEALVEARYQDNEDVEQVADGNPTEVIPTAVSEWAVHTPFGEGDYEGWAKDANGQWGGDPNWRGWTDRHVTYLGQQSVTVPAGTFDCTGVRIDGYAFDEGGWRSHSVETFWIDPGVGVIEAEFRGLDSDPWEGGESEWAASIELAAWGADAGTEITWIDVSRCFDYEQPGAHDDSREYEVAVEGPALTGLEVVTPWNETFDSDDYLPPGWAGEYFEHEAAGFWFEAGTDDGVRYLDVEWENLSKIPWKRLSTADTRLAVDYDGGRWAGTVDFDDVNQPTQEPRLTKPVHGQTDVSLQPTLEWQAWRAPPANGEIWLDLQDEVRDEELYWQILPADATSWRVPDLLDANTLYEVELCFGNLAVVNVNGFDVHIFADVESDPMFTTVPPGVTEAWMFRGYVPEAPGEETEFGLEIVGIELTGLQVNTPWGEFFDAATYLPPGWAGEDFEHEAAGLWFEAGTEEDGRRWLEVDWDVTPAQWALLLDDATDDTFISVPYTGGQWVGTVDFSGIVQPEAPVITYPAHGQGRAPLQPTFRWQRWAAPQPGGGVWFELDQAGLEDELYEFDDEPPATAQWTVPDPLEVATDYDFAVDFHNHRTGRIDGADVHVLAWTESWGGFTTGDGRVDGAEVWRCLDYEAPGTRDDDREFGIEVWGQDLTNLQITTPWNAKFDASKYLPDGWAGEDFEYETRTFWFETGTDGDQQWMETEWEGLSARQWARLDTGNAEIAVTYIGGTWNATVDFDGVAQPTQVPTLTNPVHGQDDVSVQPTLTWNQWQDPPPDGGIWLDLTVDPDGTDEDVYEIGLPGEATEWAVPDPLDPVTLYEAGLGFFDHAVQNHGGVEVHIFAAAGSDYRFTTAMLGPTEVWLNRGHDFNYPGAGDEDYEFCVEVVGIELTGLQVDTPWGEPFDAATYLPPGWAGEHVGVEDGPIEFEAGTEDGQRWLGVEWDVTPTQWALLLDDATDDTFISVPYTGGQWDGTVDFSGIVQPEAPVITYPAHGQERVPLQPTFRWQQWAAPQPGGGVWFQLDQVDPEDELYEFEDEPPATAQWTVPVLLEVEAEHDFGVDFHNQRTDRIGSADVHVLAWTESDILFTTGTDIVKPFGGKTRAEFTDESGDRVTVSLAGPGTGEVCLPADGHGDAIGIVLFGTTDRSSLTILTKGAGARTAVGDILVDGSLRSLMARTTDLLGDLEVTGSLGSLMLGDVADQHTIRIGPSDSPRAGISMTFGLVEDLTINSRVPIRSLRAIAWLDNDAAPDVIDAPSVGSLTINGQRGNARRGIPDVPGDFQADLLLSGEGDPRQTLTNARIAGSLTGAAWDITGDVGTVSVSGEADGWTLDVHSDVRSLRLGDVTNATVTVDGALGTLSALRWAGGGMTAKTLRSLNVAGRRGNARLGTEDIPGDFGVNLTLTGDPEATGRRNQTLGSARISGELRDSAWDITGDVGTVSVSGEADGWTLDVHSDVRSLRLGDVTNATVTVDGALGTLSALRWAGGGVTAKTLRSLNVAGRRGNPRRGTEDIPGDFSAALTLTGDPEATGRRNQTLGSARISGELHDSAWDITGPVGSVMIGHIATSLHLPDVSSISTSSLLIRWLHGDLPVGLIAVEGAGQVNHITFDSIRRWPRTTCDLVSEVGDPPPAAPTVFGAMTLASLKNHLGSALGRWTGDPSRLRPGLLASFDRTKDPTYRFVQRAAFVYDNALAIETLLMGNNPDAECRARAFQIADALVLLQDHDPNNAGVAADPEFPALTPAPLRDAYQAGTVATSRDATKITVRTAGFDNASSGNQAYAALALLRAADAAEEHGEAERAADYRKTAKELLLYVGRSRSRPDPLRGFAMSEDAAIGQVRATEHNIDLAAAFGRMADAEADPALKAKWEAWRDWADHFRNQMYGANERFATLPWIRDDWQYFRAGTGLANDINKDLVSLDTGAWSSLGRGDDRDVAFDLLEFLATSTDATGRTYTGFDPGFRAVADDSLTSRRDGIGSEATAYMALIARKLGDGAILAALPGRATLTADEQAAYDLVLDKANDGETDHDLADFLVGELVNIQLHAPNGDGLGLVAAPVPGVGTGEYDLVNGWALASTCWARFAFQGWNIFTGSSTG